MTRMSRWYVSPPSQRLSDIVFGGRALLAAEHQPSIIASEGVCSGTEPQILATGLECRLDLSSATPVTRAFITMRPRDGQSFLGKSGE